MKVRSVNFSIPAALVEALDVIARSELMSRSDVLRRAVLCELRAVGMDKLVESGGETP